MSFAGCINEALKERKFGPKKRDEILDRYNATREELIADGFDEINADKLAAEQTVSQHDFVIKERKKRQLAHIAKSMEVDARLDAYQQKGKIWQAATAT